MSKQITKIEWNYSYCFDELNPPPRPNGMKLSICLDLAINLRFGSLIGLLYVQACVVPFC